MNSILKIDNNSNNDNNRKSNNNKANRKKNKSTINRYNSARTASTGKTDLTKVIKFFAIACIAVGVFIAGKSVYALTIGRPRLKDTPEVSTDKMGKEVTISIYTEYPIREFEYRWNEGEITVIKGDETVDISKTIEVPNGNNILKITVIDYYGNKTEYQKQYIYESTDIIKPTIKLERVGTKLRAIAQDETEMLYMTYQWNDDEPTRIDATDGEKELSADIEVSKGRGKLTVVAVDKEENKETITRTIVGTNKPTFTVDAEQDKLVVKAKDDEGIESIVIKVDDVEEKFDGENKKEVTAKLVIEPGEHVINIIVTNVNGQEATRGLKATM